MMVVAYKLPVANWRFDGSSLIQVETKGNDCNLLCNNIITYSKKSTFYCL